MNTWKPIEEFPNYEVSNNGLVKRIEHISAKISPLGKKYNSIIGSKEMCSFDNGSGYLQVNLTHDGKRRKRYVHVLVAKAFVFGYVLGMEVDHKNEDKTDNCSTNLHWVTRIFNMSKMLESNPHVLFNLVNQ